MKEGKNEEMVMSPMFPRLHVNDTEKTKLRAPPRNKMALYEQFSISSKRFNPGSPSMLHLPPSNTGSLLHPTASSHGGCSERSVFMPSCKSHEYLNLSERLHSYPATGVKVNTMVEYHESDSTKATEFQSINAMSNPRDLQKYSNIENFTVKIGHDDQLTVLPLSHSGIDLCYSNRQQMKDSINFPQSSLSSSMPLQLAGEEQMKGNDSADPKSRQHVRNHSEKDAISRKRKDLTEPSNSIQLCNNKIVGEIFSGASAKSNDSESFKQLQASFRKESRSISVDILNGLDCRSAQAYQHCGASQKQQVSSKKFVVEAGKIDGRSNVSKVRSESYLGSSVGGHNVSSNGIEKATEICEEKYESVPVESVHTQDDPSETPVVESTSPLDVSPDDVVLMLGEKEFWKVRGAIVNQQRLFSVQVFELHRLTKVQRLIAGSPHLLLEDTIYVHKPSLDVSPPNRPPSDYVLEPPLIVEVKDHYQRSNPGVEHAGDSAVTKLPVPSINSGTGKGFVNTRVIYGPHSGHASSQTVASKSRQFPSYFSSLGNQWLVPILSPSEGLVYKPYTGPCPSTAGFPAPYGSSGHENLGPGGHENLGPGGHDLFSRNTSVPTFNHQGIGIHLGSSSLGQTSFPHYGTPVMNISISGSIVEQVNTYAGVPSKESNMSSLTSRAMSYHVGTFPVSRKSETNSPSNRTQGGVLPLFPVEPIVQSSDHDAQTIKWERKIIKAVPHNHKSAAESAARIFQFIQEERKQHD